MSAYDGGDYPAERHPQTAEDDPEQVEKKGDEGRSMTMRSPPALVVQPLP
jgi:hypothetical protein